MNVSCMNMDVWAPGRDGEIREEWRMERPGKSRGSHDDEEERTLGGRQRWSFEGTIQKNLNAGQGI